MTPRELAALFWDVNLDGFDPLQFPEFTIFRVLELGDTGAVAWARKIFSEDQIRSVISKERRLSRKSAQFWARAYGIPESDIAALTAR